MLFDPITPLSKRVPELPPDAVAVIMTALEIDPARRYATMLQLISELEVALSVPVGRVMSATGLTIRESVPPVAIRPSAAPMRPSMVPAPNAAITDVDTPQLSPFAVADHPFAPPPLDRVIYPFLLVAEPVQDRPPPQPHATSDAQVWRFERRVDPCPGVPLRFASFTPDGKRIVAFGAGTIALHESGSWRAYRSSEWLSKQTVACAALLPDGSAIIGGEHALAARILPDGSYEQWSPKSARPDVCLQGVEVTPEGWVTFVGSAAGRAGVFGWAGPHGLQLADTPMALVAVATLRKVRSLLACGPNGALVACSSGLIKAWRCSAADLLALASSGDGAHVVGAGGHAIHATDTLETSMEAVETTTTLTAVTITEAGTAWAASSKGRILRRDSRHRWHRLTPDFGVEPHLLAIWASEDRVRAVAADGSLVLGWRLRDDRAR